MVCLYCWLPANWLFGLACVAEVANSAAAAPSLPPSLADPCIVHWCRPLCSFCQTYLCWPVLLYCDTWRPLIDASRVLQWDGTWRFITQGISNRYSLFPFHSSAPLMYGQFTCQAHAQGRGVHNEACVYVLDLCFSKATSIVLTLILTLYDYIENRACIASLLTTYNTHIQHTWLCLKYTIDCCDHSEWLLQAHLVCWTPEVGDCCPSWCEAGTKGAVMDCDQDSLHYQRLTCYPAR